MDEKLKAAKRATAETREQLKTPLAVGRRRLAERLSADSSCDSRCRQSKTDRLWFYPTGTTGSPRIATGCGPLIP